MRWPALLGVVAAAASCAGCALLLGAEFGDKIVRDSGADGASEGDGSATADCGHDCLGARCQNGTCEPTLLADFADAGADKRILSIAVDDVHVYFTLGSGAAAVGTGESVYRVPKAGGPPETFSMSPLEGVSAIALDATAAYWTARNGLFVRPKNGAPQTALRGGASVKYGISVDDSYVYYVDFDSVERVDKVSGELGYQSSNGGLGSISIDDRQVYWAGSGGVRSKFKGGAMNLNVRGAPVAVVSDGTHVFWSDRADGGGIFRVLVDGGAPPVKLSGGRFSKAHAEIQSVAVDADFVYWKEAAGDLYKTRKDGSGTPALLARDAAPGGITVDDQRVYFSRKGTGPSPLVWVAK